MTLHLFYGGTFDPIHNGHIAIAKAARDALGVSVHITPVADPPHRTTTGANARQRAQMLALAVADEPGLLVDLRELERAEKYPNRPSYSIDTLKELRSEYGQSTAIAWLLGTDSFLSLPQWYQWQELFNFSHFVIAQRQDSGHLQQRLPELLAQKTSSILVTAVSAKEQQLAQQQIDAFKVFEQIAAQRWAETTSALANAPAGLLWELSQPLYAESATQVRENIAMNKPWQHLVPEAVAKFIQAENLYQPDIR